MSQIGDRIRGIRKKRGVTQGDLAKILKLSQQTIARYENGLGDVPINVIIKISKYGKESLEWLITGVEETQDAVIYESSGSVDTDLLKSAIAVVEKIAIGNLTLSQEHKAKAIAKLYEWAIIEDKTDLSDIEERKVLKIIKISG